MRAPEWALASGIVVFGLSLTSPALGQAPTDGIRVVEDAGRPLDPALRTALEFRSDREVGIHRILSTTTMSGWGAAGYGETSERLCGSPCRLELPQGKHRIRVDDSYLFGKRITVDARGEPLAWEVHRARPVHGVLGIVGTGIGLGGAFGFGTVALLDDGRGAGWALASTGVTAGGLALLLSAFAGARPVAPTVPAP